VVQHYDNSITYQDISAVAVAAAAIVTAITTVLVCTCCGHCCSNLEI
jgi:hypothetical protein